MPAATIISTLPKFVSPEEHQNIVSSTPSNFSDIPPVLRHRQEDVSVKLDPALEGLSTEDGAKGTLYVIESSLVFMSTSGRGFEVEYPAITLHAISRAESGPSIYCQLDDGVHTEVNGAASAANDEAIEMRELTIVPQNSSSLEPIFEALSLCASLHPDPADDMDDDSDAFISADAADLEIFTGEDGQELSEVGRAALEHLESIIYDPFEERRQQQQEDLEQNGIEERRADPRHADAPAEPKT